MNLEGLKGARLCSLILAALGLLYRAGEPAMAGREVSRLGSPRGVPRSQKPTCAPDADCAGIAFSGGNLPQRPACGFARIGTCSHERILIAYFQRNVKLIEREGESVADGFYVGLFTGPATKECLSAFRDWERAEDPLLVLRKKSPCNRFAVPLVGNLFDIDSDRAIAREGQKSCSTGM